MSDLSAGLNDPPPLSTTAARQTDQHQHIVNKMCLQNLQDGNHIRLSYVGAFTSARHTEQICQTHKTESLSIRGKDRMKTMSVAVVLCLNIGCDPPDVSKPHPCAVLQCWLDPFGIPNNKAAETIAKELVKQYERWQPRARCKFLSDPTIEDVKKITTSLRRSSKEERVLFHYNGHGVPQPTVNGEIWVFNKNFTQYIPLSLYDLQQWMGSPSIYVFDCSNGGVIHKHFLDMARQQQEDYELNHRLGAQSREYTNNSHAEPPNFHNFILMIATEKDEQLPFFEGMPADLFTSCLTTPIKTFIVWFIKTRKGYEDVSPQIADQIPGSVNDRKTLLGELNWIFTAITDTIAWNTLPKELFQKLFRQDLLVASLFRNYLLAQRIMRSYDCTPMSYPEIQSCHNHHLWKSWDLAVDKVLSQLSGKDYVIDKVPQSQFFTEQLTAFQVWLKLESISQTSVPEQLPIVLQVLLSQAHRSRALELLGKFLNLGPQAVDHALSVGIFPYILKLLQTTAKDVKPLLVYIWAKILAIADPYQVELIREGSYLYFMGVLADGNSASNSVEEKMNVNHQIMSAFVLSVIVRRYPHGQNTAVKSGSTNPNGSLIEICLNLLLEHENHNPSFRKWLLICLGNIWENNEDVRWLATRNSVYEKLYPFLEDPVPEVRTAAVFSLGTFVNSVTNRNEHANDIDQQIILTIVQKLHNDSSPLVRRELLVTLQWFILTFEKMFHSIIRKNNELEQSSQRCSSAGHSPKNSLAHYGSSQDSNGSSPNFLLTTIRKMSTRDGRLSIGITSNLNKLLPLPVSITVPTNLSLAGNSSPNQFTPPNSIARVASSIKSIPDYKFGTGITSIFNRVWSLLETLCKDPDPSVSKMALVLYKDVQDKYHMRDNLSMSSQSNSPNNRPDFIDSHDSARSSSRNSTSDQTQVGRPPRRSISTASFSGTGNGVYVHHVPKRSMFGREPLFPEGIPVDSNGPSPRNAHNSHSFSEPGSCRRPLIKTSFVDWCISNFSRPCQHYDICDCDSLEKDQINLDNEWRTRMLKEYDDRAMKKLQNIPVMNNKLIVTRKSLEAGALAFHPYEKNAIYSTHTDIHSWDISLANEVKSFPNEHRDRITDIKLLNTRDLPLTMVASETGAIKIWRNIAAQTFAAYSTEEYCQDMAPEPSISSAFSMFDELLPHRGLELDTKIVWQERSKQILAAGNHRIVRIWDVETERKSRDIVTEVDMVTSLSSVDDKLILITSNDGMIKLYDERTQLTRPTFSIRHHNSPVVSAKIWPMKSSIPNIVTGNRDGQITYFDQRFLASPVRTETNFGSPLSAMTFHENLDVFACSFGTGGDLRIFTLDTLKSPAIKINNEIKHLSFHPLKPKLSLISTDGTLRIMKLNLLSFSAQ